MYDSEYDFSKIPFNKVVRVGQINILNSDLFIVSWLLGRYCNYNCSYCWSHGRSDTKDHRPTYLCFKTIDSIKEQARARGFNSFQFSLSGGEPTLHPGYLDILDRFASDIQNTNYSAIHMTSNLSRGLNWHKEYLRRATKFHKAMITASYHNEHVRNEKQFADKLMYLQDHGVEITINIVMQPELFDTLYEIAMYFYDRGLNTTLKPQSDPNATYVLDYTDDQLKIMHTGMPQRESEKTVMQVELTDSDGNLWYMDQAERFNAFDFNCFKGWECSSGYRSVIIREPCGSIKRSYSCIDEPLGNIETGFSLFDKPMVCISPSCVSSADSKIPKRKIGCDLHL